MTSHKKKPRAFSFSALKKKYQKSNPTEPIDPPSLQPQDQKSYISKEGSPGVSIGPFYLVSYGGESENTKSFLENLFNQGVCRSVPRHCDPGPTEGSSSSQSNEALKTHSTGSNPSLPNVVILLSNQTQAPAQISSTSTSSLETAASLLSLPGSKSGSPPTSPENSPDRNGRRCKGTEIGSNQVPLNQDNCSNSVSLSQSGQHCSPGLLTPNDRRNDPSMNPTAQYWNKNFPNQGGQRNNTPLGQERVRMSDHNPYYKPKIVQNTSSGTSTLPQAHQAKLIEPFPFSETAGTTLPNPDSLLETTESTSKNTFQSSQNTECASNNLFQSSQSTDATPVDPSNSPKATETEPLPLHKIPEDTQNNPPLLSQATEATPSGTFDLPEITEAETLQLLKVLEDIQNNPSLLSQATETTPSGTFDLLEITEAVPFGHNQTESLPLSGLVQNSVLDSSINDENQASPSSTSPGLSSPNISPIRSTEESAFERASINSARFSYPEPKPSNKRYGKIMSTFLAANPAFFVGKEKLHWTEKAIIKTQAILNKKKSHKSFKRSTAAKIKEKLSKLSVKRRQKSEDSGLESEVDGDADCAERDCVNEAANVEEVEHIEENVGVNKTDHIGEIGTEHVNVTTHPKETKGNYVQKAVGIDQTYRLTGPNRDKRPFWTGDTDYVFIPETDNINESNCIKKLDYLTEEYGEVAKISIELVSTKSKEADKTNNQTESAGNTQNQPKTETEIPKVANQSVVSRQNQSKHAFVSRHRSVKSIRLSNKLNGLEYTPCNNDEPACPDEYTDLLILTPMPHQTSRAPLDREIRRQVIDRFGDDNNSEMERPVNRARSEPARISFYKEENTEILSDQDSFENSSANSKEMKLQASSHEPDLNNTQQCNESQAVDVNVSANGQTPKDASRTHRKTTVDGNIVITVDINALSTGIEPYNKPHTADEHVSENSQTAKDILGKYHRTRNSQNIVQSNTPVYNADLRFNKRSLPIAQHTKKRNDFILPTRPSHSKWHADKSRHVNCPRTSGWKSNTDNSVYGKIPKKECVPDILNFGHENTKRVGHIRARSFYKVRSASGNTTDKYINVQSAEKETTESGSDKEVESEKGKVGKEARFEYNVPIKVETNGEFPKAIDEFVQDIEQDKDYQETDSFKSLVSYYTAQEYEGDEISREILQVMKTIEATETPKNTKNLNTETTAHDFFSWLLNNHDEKTGRTGRKFRVHRKLNLLAIDLYLIHRSNGRDSKWFVKKITDMQRILESIQKVCEAQA